MVDNVDTGSVPAVKKVKRKAKLAQERNDAELEALINTPGGAYLVWRILHECGVYNVAGTIEPQHLAFHEGRRSVGLWLMSEVMTIDERLYSKVRNVGAFRDKGSE